MKKGTYLGIKDRNGKKLHVGDYVARAWAWFHWNEEMKTSYQIHILTWNKEYKRVLLGSTHNLWDGEDVQRISREEFEIMGIPIETDFHKDGDKYILTTGGHTFGGNEEGKREYEKWTMKMNHEINLALFLGP